MLSGNSVYKVLAIAFIIFLWGRFSWSEEHGAPAAEHGEAPVSAEKPAEGGSAGGNSEKKGDSWAEVSARVQGLKAKIASKQEILKKLLTEKNDLNEEAKKNEMVREAIKEHKELQALIKDYDKERTYLQFSFPERGQKNSKKYKRIENQKLEEFDQELSMQSKLDKSMRILKKQYKLEDKEVETTSETKKSEEDEKYPLFEPKIIQR